MELNKARIALLVFSAVSLALILFFVDYRNLSWSSNKGVYSILISYAFLATAMVGSYRQAQEQKEETEDHS